MTHIIKLILLFGLLTLSVSCRQTSEISQELPFPPNSSQPAATTPSPEATSPSGATDEPPVTATLEVSPLATRAGANYVLSLPREDSVPAGWAMDRRPDYRVREPQSGDTYRFACLDLPARSIGTASVGYRSLEGLPNVFIEYVIYDSPANAAAALADMRQALAACPEFTIGSGDSATTAGLTPLDLQAVGEASFAAALATTNTTSGELVTHFYKILQDNVVIGINHATYAADAPPDRTLTESLAALAVRNLAARSDEY